MRRGQVAPAAPRALRATSGRYRAKTVAVAAGIACATALTLPACAGAGEREGAATASDGGDGASADGASGGSSSGGPGTDGGGFGTFGDASGEQPPMKCQYQDGVDHDGDGFSYQDGDCNDCDPNSNPGAFDVPADGVDEDCNGVVDDEPTGCDANAVFDSPDPFNAALAIDICRRTTATAMGKQRTWGVVDAAFVAPDGSDKCPPGLCSSTPTFSVGHGNLTKLGWTKPQRGSRMLALSSGTARDPTDPGYRDVLGFDKGYNTMPASGFPAPAPACPGVVSGVPFDGVAIRLVIRVPTNANSFSLSENLFTYEFPDYICSAYNDVFVVEMTPTPPGLSNANIAFDQAGNPLSVNNALLQVCDPQMAGGKSFPCPLGPSSLIGTGFGIDKSSTERNHAATGWLQTKVNIDPSLKGKDMTLLIAVWDSNDPHLDSTALVDNLQWSTQPGQRVPVTTPTQ